MRSTVPVNLKTLLARFSLACAILGAVLFALPSSIMGQTAGTSYYWVASRSTTPTGARQSFVVAVDATKAAQIEAIFADGGLPGLGGTIVAGTVDYNKDYFSPDHRVWNWHYTDDFGVFDFRTTLFPACMCPSLVADPSDIAVNPRNGSRRIAAILRSITTSWGGSTQASALRWPTCPIVESPVRVSER